MVCNLVKNFLAKSEMVTVGVLQNLREKVWKLFERTLKKSLEEKRRKWFAILQTPGFKI